jgi:hypothetical protein
VAELADKLSAGERADLPDKSETTSTISDHF